MENIQTEQLKYVRNVFKQPLIKTKIEDNDLLPLMYSMIALIPSDGPVICNGVPRTDTVSSEKYCVTQNDKKRKIIF